MAKTDFKMTAMAETTDAGEVIHPSADHHNQNSPPLLASYNHKIRPILDAVDILRRLNVTQEGIPLPTIVVVGDQSSGKSSVLESLAGISLPRGQDICTRVPLVMRLQHHQDPVPEFRLEFQQKSVEIVDECKISEAISEATVEVAGNSKGISNIPLTLVVKKKGVPDLTMVDLPGITRVPVGDQPKDIYERISGAIGVPVGGGAMVVQWRDVQVGGVAMVLQWCDEDEGCVTTNESCGGVGCSGAAATCSR